MPAFFIPKAFSAVHFPGAPVSALITAKEFLSNYICCIFHCQKRTKNLFPRQKISLAALLYGIALSLLISNVLSLYSSLPLPLFQQKHRSHSILRNIWRIFSIADITHLQTVMLIFCQKQKKSTLVILVFFRFISLY